MSSPALPESLTGVGVTAIGMAMIRARETARPDHLYQDPYAQAFVAAAEREFQDSSADAADVWATVGRLVEVFYQGRTVGVRMGDDSLREAVAAGRKQIVMLGAGLDTHAFRLALPSSVHLIELDVPELFAFKERVLADEHATPTCRRSVVPADLRGDWSAPLLEAGFQPQMPTQWVDAGVLAYLLREQAWQVADTITALSAPDSRFGFGYIPLDAMARRVQPVPGAARIMPGMTTQAAEQERGLGPDAPERLEQTGWSTEFRELAPIAASYGRPLANPSGGGSIIATRQQDAGAG
ncbi:SAM-dependent methyltransferase [Actinomadura rupiterrae]|uniref:SAM-dependent methyltransferase n=1 Tax=Actinomadura rupiterrae TaxID=559627 RepID=UPI0020A3F43B|nr:SAM-dependent methyltransferase [Actinomadura rupiterrae]MCP2342149.1 methyltransferase (TIGR00027 family) [Actinomadura rupiterrae]